MIVKKIQMNYLMIKRRQLKKVPLIGNSGTFSVSIPCFITLNLPLF